MRIAASLLATGLVLIAPAAAQGAVTCTLSGDVVNVDLTSPADSVRLAVAGQGIGVTEGDGTPVNCTGGTPLLDQVNTVDIDDTASAAMNPFVDIERITIVEPEEFAPGANQMEVTPEIEFDVTGTSSFGVRTHLELRGEDDDESYLFGADGLDVNPTAAGSDVDIEVSQIARLEADGGAGDDSLRGTGGSVTGGATTEQLVLAGGEGADILEGGAGEFSFLSGDAGDDSLTGVPGEAATAEYEGAPAGVTVDLTSTGPQSTGGAGTDTLSNINSLGGSTHNDVLRGDDQANSISGDDGDDVVEGRGGPDQLLGHDGADPAGQDTVSYETAPAGVQVTLATANQQETGGAGADSLQAFDHLRGSQHADQLTGSAEGNVLEGLGGSDAISAGAGPDTVLIRDGGPDTANCGSEQDSVTADQQGVDTIDPDCELLAFAASPLPPPPVDSIAARATGLRLGPSTFAALDRGASIAQARRGTTARYRLSEAATMRFTVERRQPGRRVGRRCARPTPRNRNRRRCNRFVRQRGSFTHRGAAGANSFRFSGRLRNRKLRPGRYRLVGVPTDAAGNVGVPVRASFRIVRR
jgi:Ca2+-binding RTX toxin-like protein